MLLELLVRLDVARMVTVIAVGKRTFTLPCILVTHWRPLTRPTYGDTRQEYGLAYVRSSFFILLRVFHTSCILIAVLLYLASVPSNGVLTSVLWLAYVITEASPMLPLLREFREL